MKTITLSQGLEAMVDDEDFQKVSSFKWCAQRRGRNLYAIRTTRKCEGSKRTTVSLHSFLLPGFETVDHFDGNGLNNQRHNLRGKTHTKNCQAFRRKAKGGTSKFLGVSYGTRAKKWQAIITNNRRAHFLGYFQTEIEAAHAYDQGAKKYFGMSASFNFLTREAV